MQEAKKRVRKEYDDLLATVTLAIKAGKEAMLANVEVSEMNSTFNIQTLFLPCTRGLVPFSLSFSSSTLAMMVRRPPGAVMAQ